EPSDDRIVKKGPIMRRKMFGLICCALLIGGRAIAADGAPSSDTAATTPAAHVKKVAATKPKKSGPVPLSTAERATTGNADLPVRSSPASPAKETSTGYSWTGAH